MSVRQQLKLVSEADGRFDTDAPEHVRRAVELARRASTKTPQELEQQAKEMGLRKEIRARYKIEITFDANRTVAGPNLLGIQLWESGRRLHGGGDDLMYWCRSTESDEGCWGVITSDSIKGGVACCPSCQRLVNVDLLTNMKIGRVTTKTLAQDVEKIFRQLGSNADIYLKFHKSDIRYIAMVRAKGPDIARRLKGMHIYPLKNIIKDTANGADLVGRLKAFLTS